MYARQRLRAPTRALVRFWAKKENVSPADADRILEHQPFRHMLGVCVCVGVGVCERYHPFFSAGPDAGVMSNTRTWKALKPTSFKSPFMVQGDIGFFALNKKKFGQFLVLVQTFSGTITALPIPNTRSATLITALTTLLKVGFPPPPPHCSMP